MFIKCLVEINLVNNGATQSPVKTSLQFLLWLTKASFP